MYKHLQVLNTLLLTKERDLPALHEQRFASTAVTLERLQHVRGLVATLIEGLRHPDDADLWSRIDEAYAASEAAPEAPPSSPKTPEVPPAPPPTPGPAGPPPRPLRSPSGAVSPWAQGAAKKSADAVEATAMFDGEATPEALPFKPGAGAAPIPAADLGPGPDAGATAMLDAAAGDVNATAFLDEDAPVAEALPFAPHPPRGPARDPDRELDLEGYARLCAECSVWPDHTKEINERYGLTTAVARGKVDLQWQKQLAKDPTLRASWQSSFEAHKARLRQG